MRERSGPLVVGLTKISFFASNPRKLRFASNLRENTHYAYSY